MKSIHEEGWGKAEAESIPEGIQRKEKNNGEVERIQKIHCEGWGKAEAESIQRKEKK